MGLRDGFSPVPPSGPRPPQQQLWHETGRQYASRVDEVNNDAEHATNGPRDGRGGEAASPSYSSDEDHMPSLEHAAGLPRDSLDEDHMRLTQRLRLPSLPNGNITMRWGAAPHDRAGRQGGTDRERKGRLRWRPRGSRGSETEREIERALFLRRGARPAHTIPRVVAPWAVRRGVTRRSAPTTWPPPGQTGPSENARRKTPGLWPNAPASPRGRR